MHLQHMGFIFWDFYRYLHHQWNTDCLNVPPVVTPVEGWMGLTHLDLTTKLFPKPIKAPLEGILWPFLPVQCQNRPPPHHPKHGWNGRILYLPLSCHSPYARTTNPPPHPSPTPVKKNKREAGKATSDSIEKWRKRESILKYVNVSVFVSASLNCMSVLYKWCLVPHNEACLAQWSLLNVTLPESIYDSVLTYCKGEKEMEGLFGRITVIAVPFSSECISFHSPTGKDPGTFFFFFFFFFLTSMAHPKSKAVSYFWQDKKYIRITHIFTWLFFF